MERKRRYPNQPGSGRKNAVLLRMHPDVETLMRDQVEALGTSNAGYIEELIRADVERRAKESAVSPV